MKKIFFVHGMFMTSRCWDGWVERFSKLGYDAEALAWPGRELAPAQLRQQHPDAALARLRLSDILDHHSAKIRAQAEPPILIGHSMGGCIVQLLLTRGLGACGVAIDSAPPKGVFTTKWSFLRANWPMVSPFTSIDAPMLMSLEQFAYAFVHQLPPEEQKEVYQAHVVPESRRVGRAPLGNEAEIEFSKPHRPLLFIAGGEDRIVPASLNRSNFEKYKDPGSRRDFKEFPSRAHYIIGQPGWTEVADHARAWIENI